MVFVCEQSEHWSPFLPRYCGPGKEISSKTLFLEEEELDGLLGDGTGEEPPF
jgi:hypothetical protein